MSTSIGSSNFDATLSKIRNSWLLPSLPEFVTFAVIIVLLFLLFALFHNNSIQSEVRKKSRCLRAKETGRKGGQYMVTATNKDNQELYRIGYDLSSRQFNVQCACPEGKVTNTFRRIPVYNLNTMTSQTIPEKSCACDTSYYRTGDSVYYNGYPGLVSYMNSGDTTFFKESLG